MVQVEKVAGSHQCTQFCRNLGAYQKYTTKSSKTYFINNLTSLLSSTYIKHYKHLYAESYGSTLICRNRFYHNVEI